jgi:hypothetical protein
MNRKRNQTAFRFCTIVGNNLVDVSVMFEPAPPPGGFAELAKFEAELIFLNAVRQKISDRL